MLSETSLKLHKNGLTTYIMFIRSHANMEYLMWTYNSLAKFGLYGQAKPKFSIKTGKHNKILRVYSQKSFSFSWLNSIYNYFYIDNVKIIPKNNIYLTPLALVIWFLEDGLIVSGKEINLKISSNFKSNDVVNLCEVLKEKYNLCTVYTLGTKNHNILIKKTSVDLFFNIIKPYLVYFPVKKK